MLTKEELEQLSEKKFAAHQATQKAIDTSVERTLEILTTMGYNVHYRIGRLDTDHDFEKHRSGDWYVYVDVALSKPDGSREFGADFTLYMYKDHFKVNVGTVGAITKKSNPACINMYRVLGYLFDHEEELCKAFNSNMDYYGAFELDETANKLSHDYYVEERAIKDYAQEQIKQAFFAKLKPGATLYRRPEFEHDGKIVPCYKVEKVCGKIVKANPYDEEKIWDYKTMEYNAKYTLKEYCIENVKVDGIEYRYVIFD